MLQATVQIVTALLICFVQCLYIVLREACVRGFDIIVEIVARIWWLLDCYIQDTVTLGVTWYEILPDESDVDVATYVTREYVESVKTIWLCFFEAFGVYAAGTWYLLGLEEISDDEDDDMEVSDYAPVLKDYVDEEMMCTQLE
jgi:hypothetical protein